LHFELCTLNLPLDIIKAMKNKEKTNENNNSKIGFFPPVVSVLGHVDHGKTTLLDAIRKTDIAKREHGGITQKIGASSVEIVHEGKKRTITFIDTPGHETFRQMRGRGAKVSDVGILVVAATEGVMPQTKESIKAFQEAGIPIIVVLTKSDLPTKNPEKAKQQLLKEGVILEGFGGDVPVLEVSAKEGRNVKELLDLILLVFDLKQVKSFEKEPFEGVIIESKLDKKSGPLASIVVKKGKLLIKDDITADNIEGKIKALISSLGERVLEANVGEAVEILGFEKVPQVGSLVYKKNELALEKREVEIAKVQNISPSEKELLIILVADSEGSLEALEASLPENVGIILKKTGEVSEADVFLAKSAGAIVTSFNTKIRNEVLRLSDQEKVLVKNYTIIYELIDEIKDVLEGKKLALVEKIFGRAKVLASFPFEKTKVLGVNVIEGRVAKGDKARLMRGEEIIGESHIQSVRQGKNIVSKIEKGQEGGVIIVPFLDFTIGDVLICHG